MLREAFPDGAMKWLDIQSCHEGAQQFPDIPSGIPESQCHAPQWLK
jgi:hypothetical protein